MTNYWGQAEKKMASATCMASSAYLLANSATVFQNQSLTRQMQPQRLQTADLPALQVASLVVQEQFAKDAQIIPDLGETLSACELFIVRALEIYSNRTSGRSCICIVQPSPRRHSSTVSKEKVCWNTGGPFPIL